MAKATRGAVVSVRMSDDEHARLRAIAEARGETLSELVRSVVVREMIRPAPSASVTMTPLSQPAALGEGVVWNVDSQEPAPTGTLIVRR
jgi:hypothetical protein